MHFVWHKLKLVKELQASCSTYDFKIYVNNLNICVLLSLMCNWDLIFFVELYVVNILPSIKVYIA
jgi:hypothetical protein